MNASKVQIDGCFYTVISYEEQSKILRTVFNFINGDRMGEIDEVEFSLSDLIEARYVEIFTHQFYCKFWQP
ncbi:hypothetical protein [Colwellia psychrerythraea]|nr:hypothetical protein [Colwellia psychrerythraea]